MACEMGFCLTVAVLSCLWLAVPSSSDPVCPDGCLYESTGFLGLSRSVSCQGVRLEAVFDCMSQGVTSLSVTNANISELSVESLKPLSGFPGLTYLSLSGNKIVTLEPKLFTNTPNLGSLNLSHNDLADLAEDTFLGLSKLHTLDLSHNGLNTTILSSLQTLDSVAELILNHNNIEDLSCSRIAQIKLGNLIKLEVVDNYLVSLDSCAFLGSTSVTFFNASSNNIRFIASDTFYSVPQLQTLSLRDNELGANSAVEPISALENLQVFSLTRNNLQEVPLVIQNLTSLKTLYLSDNPIRTLRSTDLFGLEHLEEFYFRRLPDLTSMEPGSLDHLPSLRVLAIEENTFLNALPLSSIPETNLQSLTHLMVRGNGVTVFTEREFMVAPRLLQASVGANPLHCNCDVAWMRRVMEDPARYPWAQDWLGPAGPSCSTPVSMKKEHVVEIDARDLTCDAPVILSMSPLEIVVPTQSTVTLQALLSVGIPTATWFDPMGIPLKAASGGAAMGSSAVTEERLANNSVLTTAILSDITSASSGQYTLVAQNADKGTAMTYYVKVTEQAAIQAIDVQAEIAKDTLYSATAYDPTNNDLQSNASRGEGMNMTSGQQHPSTTSHESATVTKITSTPREVPNISSVTTQSAYVTTSVSGMTSAEDADHSFKSGITDQLPNSTVEMTSSTTTPLLHLSTGVAVGIGSTLAPIRVAYKQNTIVISILVALSLSVLAVMTVVLFRVRKFRREPQYTPLAEVELGPTKRTTTDYGSFRKPVI